MIIEVGTYENPNAVGFKGWMKNQINVVFINLDGTFTEPFAI